MHINRTSPFAIRSFAAAAVVGLFPGPAPGDVILAEWNSSIDYTYLVVHVPDFDQRRLGLPNNGAAYCVPTACMNWMAYFAAHGDPSLPPGIADWQSPSTYDRATPQIGFMGFLMSTDEDSGTSGGDGITGLQNWLNISDKGYIAFRYDHDLDWAPTLNTLAHHAIQGGYVAPCVGWYDTSDFPYIDRDGGHCMSLVHAARGDGLGISVMDPAFHEGDLSKQSPFTINTYSVTNQWVKPFPPPFEFQLIMSRINGLGSGGKTAYLKAFYVIYPAFVVTASEPGSFTWTFKFPSGSSGEEEQAYAAPPEWVLVDVTLHADASVAFAIAEQPGAPNRLFEVNPVTGEWTHIDVPMEGPQQLHVSRMRDLYVLDITDIVCVAVDPEIPEQITRVTPPQLPAALTSNDATNEIAVLGSSRLFLYPYALAGDPISKGLPPGFPTDFSGGGAFSYDPLRRAYWAVTPGQDVLHLLQEDSTGELIASAYGHSAIVAPHAIDIGDDGRLYVSTGGALREFELVDDELVLVSDPRFPGVQAGAILQVGRSRTNHDEALHGGPASRHVLPDVFDGEHTLVCRADLDHDRIIGFSDLLVMLGAWGPCPADEYCHADLDSSGEVGFSDLLELLGAWGDCP